MRFQEDASSSPDPASNDHYFKLETNDIVSPRSLRVLNRLAKQRTA